MHNPRVSIIILNWNGWKDTIKCLESLYRIVYPKYDVIVVDNGSEDCSIQKIKEYAEGKIRVDSKFFEYNPTNKPIKVFETSEDEVKQGKFNRPLYDKYDVDRRMILIRNKDNYGFTGGNNVGIKFALSVFNPEYVLILNNDTIIDKRFLSELVKVMEKNKKIGIAGPKVYYYEYNGSSHILNFDGIDISLWTFHRKRYRFRKPDMKNNFLDRVRITNIIMGCCMLVRPEVFVKNGLFDETLFMYWDEVDFCLRSEGTGFMNMYVPFSKVWHKVGGSFKSKGPSILAVYYYSRNRILVYFKNTKRSKERTFFVLYTIFVNMPTYTIGYIIKYKKLELASTYLKGALDAIKLLRQGVI